MRIKYLETQRLNNIELNLFKIEQKQKSILHNQQESDNNLKIMHQNIINKHQKNLLTKKNYEEQKQKEIEHNKILTQNKNKKIQQVLINKEIQEQNRILLINQKHEKINQLLLINEEKNKQEKKIRLHSIQKKEKNSK